MSDFKSSGNYRGAIQRLRDFDPRKFNKVGEAMSQEAAEYARQVAIANLESQGRGGNGPPLSSATTHLYANRQSTGDRLKDNIHVFRVKGGWAVGIAAGDPTTIARVQDRGATIHVTDRMRNYLHSQGIHLKSSTQVIHIPGRRFWSDALLQTRDRFKQKMKQAVKTALKV